jgi:hypothetical protein
MKRGKPKAKDIEILNLYKYFIWADRMRSAYDSLLERNTREVIPHGEFETEYNLYMSYWFSSLYIVIEGWKNLGLSDKKIDVLLDSPNVDLLRRYRNGVFHFQKDYFDERFLGFLRDGISRIVWIRNLQHEFEKFFMAWSESHSGFF